jgi:hypothetical protein
MHGRGILIQKDIPQAFGLVNEMSGMFLGKNPPVASPRQV